jgi:outer membrane protein assembly factor BamE (lipoprotein component of BamABCDE complex)
MHRNSRLARMFSSVHPGASEEQVIQLLKRPSWVEPCGKSFGPLVENCWEYIYRDSFAPLIPQYWSVRFDASRHVQSTYVYQSP